MCKQKGKFTTEGLIGINREAKNRRVLFYSVWLVVSAFERANPKIIVHAQWPRREQERVLCVCDYVDGRKVAHFGGS